MKRAVILLVVGLCVLVGCSANQKQKGDSTGASPAKSWGFRGCPDACTGIKGRETKLAWELYSIGLGLVTAFTHLSYTLNRFVTSMKHSLNIIFCTNFFIGVGPQRAPGASGPFAKNVLNAKTQ